MTCTPSTQAPRGGQRSPATALFLCSLFALACNGSTTDEASSTGAGAAGAGGGAGSAGAGGAAAGSAGSAGSSPKVRFKGEAWADNWFAMYAGDALVVEDSVPITTEKSFNAETFELEASYPLLLAFVLKDFAENESGLEYIGKPNQQMGDGGFSFQLTDTTTGKVVLVSDESWRCHVIQKAPLNPSCEKDPNPLQTCQHASEPEPEGWKAPGFDDAGWEKATVFTAAQVGPKDGYFGISWSPQAKLIWTSDLKADNTLLCRARVTAP